MLEGKTALITGGGQGVGQGIALALASKGANVVVTGRTLEKCETSAQLIEKRGATAMAPLMNLPANCANWRGPRDC